MNVSSRAARGISLANDLEIKLPPVEVDAPDADSDGVAEPKRAARAAAFERVRRGVVPVVIVMLVEQSGGTLTVESAERQGTTFVVVLPRYDVDDYLTRGRQRGSFSWIS